MKWSDIACRLWYRETFGVINFAFYLVFCLFWFLSLPRSWGYPKLWDMGIPILLIVYCVFLIISFFRKFSYEKSQIENKKKNKEE